MVSVTASDASFTVSVKGDEFWRGEFALPNSITRLETGVYNNLTRFPFHDRVVGGLSWTGEGRGCGNATGSLTINEVVYDGDRLTLIDFEVRAVLRRRIRCAAWRRLLGCRRSDHPSRAGPFRLRTSGNQIRA